MHACITDYCQNCEYIFSNVQSNFKWTDTLSKNMSQREVQVSPDSPLSVSLHTKTQVSLSFFTFLWYPVSIS